MIIIQHIPRDRFLETRIHLAQTIARLVDEQTEIASFNGYLTTKQIACRNDINDRLLPNAINGFRLHMEGSGSLSSMYRDADAVTIQTIALDFLRTIQMVEQDMTNQRAR